MKYRRVGRWGLEVSAVGLGSWPASAENDNDVIDILRRAYDLGVGFFDTANFYRDGERERVVGRALGCFPRESYVLGTKVSFPIGPPPNNQGLSRKHIIEQCEASLRRLSVDHIDLYQCHRFEPDTPLEETCGAMNDLVHTGKVLYWGVTSWPAAGIVDAVSLCADRGWVPPISDQEQYSALCRTPERDHTRVCSESGLGLMAWSPLAMGVLAGRYTSLRSLPEGSRATKGEARWMSNLLTEHTLAAVNEARELARTADISLAQLALGWCLAQSSVSCVVVGASSSAQLEQTVGAADRELDSTVLSDFDAIFASVATR